MADNIGRRLARHKGIGLDTSIFIYHFEAHADYLGLTRQILTCVETGECNGIVSVVTLMELTVHPWHQDQSHVARGYETLLLNFPHLQLVAVDRHIARQAAQLRAAYRINPADALQVATAIMSGATLWVTNDKQLGRLAPEIEVMILADYLAE